MNSIIVNADDYGMSEKVVDSIVECAQAGVITSTSMMATGEAFAYGRSRLPELGKISVGVHLNATLGRPVLPPNEIPSLVEVEGRFKPIYGPREASQASPSDLKREYLAQVEKVLSNAVQVSHLDHHHGWIYFSPTHFQVLVEIAQKYSLPIRYPFAGLSESRVKRFCSIAQISETQMWQAAQKCAEILAQNPAKYPDYFWPEFSSLQEHSPENFLSLLNELPEGISEIVVHPGRSEAELSLLLQLGAEGVFRASSEREWMTYKF